MARGIVGLIQARAVVHVLDARLNGDGERSAEDWETIRAQAASLVSFAKWKRDQARARKTTARTVERDVCRACNEGRVMCSDCDGNGCSLCQNGYRDCSYCDGQGGLPVSRC